MKKIIIFLFLSIVSIFPLMALDNVNLEWIKKDEAIIKSMLDFIEHKDFSDEEINKFITSTQKNAGEPRKMGFGLKKLFFGFSEGYIGVTIDYVSYKKMPCKLILSVHSHEFCTIKNHLNKDVAANFFSVFKPAKGFYGLDAYIFAYDFADNYKKFSEHKKTLAGEMKDIQLPKEYQAYYDFLFSAETETVYGYMCGIGGDKPEGRRAMEKLLKLNDKNVFINLLKGDNPCGRIYAAEGLLRLENSKENVKIINEIFSQLRKERVTYTKADGCFFSEGEKYTLYKYDENLTFPEDLTYPDTSEEKDFVLNLDFPD